MQFKHRVPDWFQTDLVLPPLDWLAHLAHSSAEPATVMLTLNSADGTPRTWGLKLKERIGFKRVAVDVARRLAVQMHAVLRGPTRCSTGLQEQQYDLICGLRPKH